MNVQELRESKHVESVEEYNDRNWRVAPNHDSYNTQNGVSFLLSLNVKWEESNGDLVVPKGNIIEN